MLPEVKAVVFIPLTQGKVAVIDFDDFEKVRHLKWCAVKKKHTWYARHDFGKGRSGLLHRFLLDAPPKVEVGHKDGDGLNNQRFNIRTCSRFQNACGVQRKGPRATSTFRGVAKDFQTGLWRAKICFRGTTTHLGRFKNEEDAARAYDAKARELFGEWASPNFPT